MPIYAYRCASCGHAKDVLQKISDPPLTVCPACGAADVRKQVTAAGFQLKGSGWYVTDFRGDKKRGEAPKRADGGADRRRRAKAGGDDGGARPAPTATRQAATPAGARAPRAKPADAAAAAPRRAGGAPAGASDRRA